MIFASSGRWIFLRGPGLVLDTVLSTLNNISGQILGSNFNPLAVRVCLMDERSYTVLIEEQLIADYRNIFAFDIQQSSPDWAGSQPRRDEGDRKLPGAQLQLSGGGSAEWPVASYWVSSAGEQGLTF